MNKRKSVKGQILLITLLVLTILSILTITLIVLNSRDVAEVEINQKYDQIYSTVENKVQDFVRNYGQYEISLGTLVQPPNNCTALTTSSYDCDFTQVSSTLNLSGEVLIANNKNYDNYEVFKDRTLEINVLNYRDSIDFYWEKPGLASSDQAVLEFLLIYRQSSGTLRTKQDLYDPSGIYTSSSAVGTPFTYLENPAYPGNLYARRINFATTLAANEVPEKLVVIPRMVAASNTVELDVSPVNAALYPDQVRTFKGKSYDPIDPSSPVVNIITQIPIYPQTMGLLDYALLTSGEITLN